MKIKITTRKPVLLALLSFIVLCTTLSASGATAARALRQGNVTGGPRGPYPYLLKSVSSLHLLETGRDHQWSITFKRQQVSDTLRIIALRVEFNGGRPDTSVLKTGNGLFGIRGGFGDADEYARYLNDTIYKYDRLPRDSLYFAMQLQAISAYYAKISRGRLVLRSTIYPARGGDLGCYAVPKPVLYYSPGGKKQEESWDDYYFRKTRGLMLFVSDAISAAAKDSSGSPFANLRFNPADSTIRDENNLKTVFLIFHAGASYLTDGGSDGSMGRNTPGDMIDAFIDRSWFKMFKDSLKIPATGVRVKASGSDSITVSELMLCSETSNQDGLNWGIQGILVNQLARQLGIPDLFSTSSGVSAIGAFCIMDFAGYSAGNGFIPPYPSAWVRAFMGWDEVKVASLNARAAHCVKALTSLLDRDSLPQFPAADTTILLVPLNDHEYYLVENRQRNLSGSDSLFRYDSAAETGRVIAAYPFNVNIDSNVVATSGKGPGRSNVILRVRNNDICLPASGVLVWHVDEQIIRNRLASDMVNADSSVRGVVLVEADGVPDLGVTFQDVFYQAAYDYGGAEDVFPHRTEKKDLSPLTVRGFGPYTAPSSKSNDGGNTYLHLDIARASGSTREERSAIRDYTVADFTDSVFTVTAWWDYLVPGWPKFAAPESFYEPLLADLDTAHPGKELVLLSKSGRLSAWSTDTGAAGITYGAKKVLIDRIDMLGDTVRAADTSVCIDSIPGTIAMPSAVAGKVFIPSRTNGLKILASLSAATGAIWDSVVIGDTAASYVCGYRGDSSWAIGCEHGRVVFGRGRDTIGLPLQLASGSAVCALAALRDKPSTIAVMQNDGALSLCTEGRLRADTSAKVPNAVGPFTLVTGDLDRDSVSEIVVCDSRHGLWVYRQTMRLAPGWEARPSDWPSVYASSPGLTASPNDRSRLPVNRSSPALVDLNRDGYLDIVVGGTNGLYAFNYKGVLVGGWPSYLDNRFWYQRGSVVAAPIAVTGTGREPLVIFSSPTGEKATFHIAKIDSADRSKGMIWFKNETGRPDSLWDLSRSLIDTLFKFNDSLVMPYVTPGGFVDAVKGNGRRPLVNTSLLPPGVTPVLLSSWPLTTGSSPATSPLAGQADNAASLPDLFVVAASGWVYRWRLAREIMPDSLFWPGVGYDACRSFAYGGGVLPILKTDKDPITFFSYPNPTAGSPEIMFKYKFSAPAANVRLDIFTFSGFSVFSSTAMGLPPSHLTGSYPDWNEFRVPVGRLAPAVFRCRMEAVVNGKKYAKFWKLAVTK